MVDLFWRLFEKTGFIGCYLLYKVIEKAEDERFLGLSPDKDENASKAYQIRKESI
ncbi:MAG: YqzL family protein [Clostridiales bacterium]|jgi:hypothetical protein|nr:YqzL family protein [Clostridiales bacterium]